MKKFTWIVEFTIDPSWVADGFELTEERAKEMIENELPHSYFHETSVRIIKAPREDLIKKEQGYLPAEC